MAAVTACVPDPDTNVARAPDATAPAITHDDASTNDDAAAANEDAAAPSDDAAVANDDAQAAPADARVAPDAAPRPDASSGACDPLAAPTPHAGLSEAPGIGGCPAGMTPAGAICVDRYEAVLFELPADTAWSPFQNPGMHRVRAASIEGVTPQAYISGRQAGAACTEAGKRICTDAEWLRACRGANTQTYPYGTARQVGVCNDHRAMHPAIELFGTSADWIWSELGNACIDQLPNSLAPTGSFTGCVTAEGVFDLMGNLHEWTADPNGTFRGGYYVDTVINGAGCNYATVAHDTGHWDYSTGFRCCADHP